jgi:hypothetical protein
MYGVRIMGANIANKYPNETMVILNKILPEDILNDTSIGLIDILDKIAYIFLKYFALWQANKYKKFLVFFMFFTSFSLGQIS